MEISGEFLLFAAVVALFTATAAVVDLRTRKIPNWLTVPALAAALVYHAAFDGWGGLATAAGGFALGFGVLFVLWIVGGGGGGDVKLMGAVGAWLGPQYTLWVLVLSTALVALVGGAIAGYVAVTRGWHAARPRPPRRATKDASAQRSRRRLMTFGLPVAVATWLVLAVQFAKAPAETALGQATGEEARESGTDQRSQGPRART